MLKIISKENFQSISQFSIIQSKKLGSGSFGTVKLAIHNLTNRMYALKIISLVNVPSQSQLKLIERQIKLHSEVDHPHIFKVWDTFNDSQNIYMVMEYAQMGNLFYYQNTKNIFSEAEAFRFFSQTISAVNYLHANDIIHRDLKVKIIVILMKKQPENLLLDQYLNLKICDFGWCAENINMKRNTFCGTYEYMAPEMIFHKDYDYRVDIWALGILLYEMLHGYAPFKGKTTEEVQASMLRGTYEINPKLSPQVKRLIEEILQFKVEERLSIGQIMKHTWMKDMKQTVKDYLKEEKVTLPTEIEPKLGKMPISYLKLRALNTVKKGSQSRKYHRKNNSMNLQQESSNNPNNNININLSINNFSIVNKKNKKQLYHSQDKFCEKDLVGNNNNNDKQDQVDINFNNFREVMGKYSNGKQLYPTATSVNKGKNQIRCKTLIDEDTKIERCQIGGNNTKSKFYANLNTNKLSNNHSRTLNINGTLNNNHNTVKKLSKDNLFETNQLQNKKNESKLQLNFIKKNFKLRKSQDKIDKSIRFNTQAYDKQDQSYLIKLKKNTKKRKILTSSKNIKLDKN